MNTNYAEVLPWIQNKNDTPGVILGDVTSRDGLQSLPWWNYWTKEQRAELSVKLAELGIHHIEVGFPAMKGDPEYDAVKYTADTVGERETVIIGLARLVESDVANTIDAISGAKHRGIHTFVGTSPEHLSTFSFGTEDILRNIEARITQIRDAGCIAQFSAEDATRTELDLLVEVYEKALNSGAQILNIPDTLGYYDVAQFLKLLEHLKVKFPQAIISSHTHNDKSQAEQSALVAASQGFAQKIEGTIYGIGERAGNADIITLIAIILQDPAYKTLAHKLIQNPKKFTEVLEYMEEISGIHMRPVAPGYGYEAIVNRSGVHQAKVAKIKESYIAYPGTLLGLDGRPQMEISALSGYHGVLGKFSQDFGIVLTEEQAKKLTAVYRNIFSPDTDPESIHDIFPDLSSKYLYQNIVPRIQKIREQARKLKNTKGNIEKWNEETDSIIRDIYDHIYPKT